VRSARGEFTVGICATGEPPSVAELVSSILAESQSTTYLMRKLVIVASECPDETISSLRALQRVDGRIDLLVEETRRGKADAVNKILGRSETPLVLFANSDSRPKAGAITSLLFSMESDERIGAVSAIPEPESSSGLVPLLLGFMWTAHNRCSVALNHMGVSNHSCDELVLFRTRAITLLPKNIVNDGAFLASTARLRGFSIKVSTAAGVRIKTPRRISDVILQRRRILFGHAQVWRQVGTPPKTIESLLFLSPSIGIRLLVATLASRPKSLVVLPIALVSEVLAGLLSIVDVLQSSKVHAVWRRFK